MFLVVRPGAPSSEHCYFCVSASLFWCFQDRFPRGLCQLDRILRRALPHSVDPTKGQPGLTFSGGPASLSLPFRVFYKHLLFLIANIVTTSKALVTTSDALVPSSFLFY